MQTSGWCWDPVDADAARTRAPICAKFPRSPPAGQQRTQRPGRRVLGRQVGLAPGLPRDTERQPVVDSPSPSLTHGGPSSPASGPHGPRNLPPPQRSPDDRQDTCPQQVGRGWDLGGTFENPRKSAEGTAPSAARGSSSDDTGSSGHFLRSLVLHHTHDTHDSVTFATGRKANGGHAARLLSGAHRSQTRG